MNYEKRFVKYTFVLFSFFSLLLPSFVHARQPYASELVSVGKSFSSNLQLIRATSTNPFFITSFSFSNDANNIRELRCDGVVFNVSLGSALTSFWTVDTPVRCAGSVYGYVNPSSFSSAHVSLTGFEMSDVDFNKPYEVATSTSSGGGSGVEN